MASVPKSLKQIPTSQSPLSCGGSYEGRASGGSTSMEAKYYLLASCLRDISNKAKSVKNDAEIVQMALDKAKMACVSKFKDCEGGFSCDLLIDCVLIATGIASNKKTAKHLAYEKATELLRKPYLKIENIAEAKDEYRLLGSIEPFKTPDSPSCATRCNFSTGITKLGQDTKSNIQCLAKLQKTNVSGGRKRPATGLTEICAGFVVMEHANANTLSTLKTSADVCHMELKYEFVDLPDARSRCQILLDDFVLMDFIGDSRASAKTEAAKRALQLLKKRCYTIISKQIEDACDANDTVLRETLTDDVQKIQNIPESNIGNRLLKKIGWTGGGLGKEGNKGIVEPVSLESVINREGLGLNAEKGISKDFPQKIQKIIEDYMHSEKQEDLIFSSTFTKDERAVIHQKARKFQLKNKSYGQNEDRFLVLSRKRTPAELVAHIRANGGETSKYILESPGGS